MQEMVTSVLDVVIEHSNSIGGESFLRLCSYSQYSKHKSSHRTRAALRSHELGFSNLDPRSHAATLSIYRLVR